MTPQALEWLERFERYLATERRLSAHTLSAYRRDLAGIARLVRSHRHRRDWQQLDHQHMRTFAARSHARGLERPQHPAPAAALRTFFGFLHARRRRSRATRRVDVRAPKAAKRLPHTLDVDQMARLLALKPAGNALEVRDLALMELLYSTGLRLAELVGLKLRDLDLADRTGAGARQGQQGRASCRWARRRPTALRLWLARARRRWPRPDEQALFVGRSGAPLGARAVQLRVAAPGAGRRVCRSTCIRTCSGIPSPPICLNPAAICAACRNCWATPTSAPPRSTPTLISSIWPAYTTRRIRAPNAAVEPRDGQCMSEQLRSPRHDDPRGAPRRRRRARRRRPGHARQHRREGQRAQGAAPVQRQGAGRLRRRHRRRLHAVRALRGQAREARQPDARRGRAGQGLAHRPLPAPPRGAAAGRRPAEPRSSSPAPATCIEPEHGVVAIGSGGPYAQAAARALLENTELDAARHRRARARASPPTSASTPTTTSSIESWRLRMRDDPAARSSTSSTSTSSARPTPSARWRSRCATAGAACRSPSRCARRSRRRTS